MRYLDNGIYRDQRQRKIISGMFNGVGDMLNLAFTSYSFATKQELKQAEFPIIDDVHVKGGKYKDAGWVWLYDVNSVCVLHDFIYDDIMPEDNEYLKNNDNIELNY